MFLLTTNIDQVKLAFDPVSLTILNIILGFVMFGIALEIKAQDFRLVFRNPKPFLIGLMAQFILLPAATYGLILLIKPAPSIALGMMLVAACPGGNISNFLTHFARGNTALSVGMTAVSTAISMFFTPFNLTFWAGRYEPTKQLLREIQMDPLDMVISVGLLLVVPLILGMLIGKNFPKFVHKTNKFFRYFSISIFLGFVGMALAKNFSHFLNHVGSVAFFVFLQNFTALSLGYFSAKIAQLSEKDARACSIEVGIQNSGLGLILIFNTFGGLGGMAIIAAWWGIWHMISGLTIASIWRKIIPVEKQSLNI